MFIDATHFPIVWMHYQRQHIEQTLEQTVVLFEQNLDRDAPFVLVAVGAETESNEREPADTREKTLWIRKHRSRLLKRCRSMILVEPSSIKRLVRNAFRGAFAKYWGHPMVVVSSREEAVKAAQGLLSGADIQGLGAT